jgi:ubiquinone/menaquinone biosynthesis C-methylase UbiE
VLVLLQDADMSGEQMREAIRERSAENRDFRPSGQLLVEARDMRLVLGQLSRRGLISQGDRGWRLRAAGQNRLARYEEQRETELNGKQRAARKVVKLMGEPEPGQAALDVGTGEGFLAFKVADRGYRVLGIDTGGFDYSRDSIRSAIEEAKSRGGEVEFREISAAELAETDAGFAYAVTSQAMHCMEDQRQCLDAIHRLLEPGGEFLCMDFLVGVEGFLHHGWHSFLAISREEWEELLPEFGFTPPTCRKAGDYLVVRARRAVRNDGEPR